MRIGALILILATATPGLSYAQIGCGMPIVGKDGWPVAKPESVGLSSATLCSMVKWLNESKQNNLHAVQVVRYGQLVFEQYFTGTDEHLGRAVGQVKFGPEATTKRSVTKSVTGLVLGISIDRRWIKDIEDPVLSFFPEYADLRNAERIELLSAVC